MPLPDNLPEHLLSPREHQIFHNNRYLQDQKLGSGNFGTAYLVFDSACPSNEEEKKVLKRIHVGDIEPGETNDAKKEAILLSRLHHENVVQFHESFFDGKYFCIITEYCDGGDMDMKLQEYKKKNEFVAESQVTEWLFQLLKALRYLHRQHILHRDLKAKNIFLKANCVKLGDFGISKILMGTSDMASTFVGTPYYMSPEVIKHDKYHDKSDIWSLGCILYEICTLKHAFDGQSLMAVMYKIVTGDIPHLPDMYSGELNTILGKMLAREQHDRFTATQLLKHDLFHPKHDRPTTTTGLTPKERLRIRKQKEADEKFRKLQELAEKTRLDNDRRHRESVSRNFYHSSIENFSSEDAKRPATSYHPRHDSRNNVAAETRKSDVARSVSETYERSKYYSKEPSGSATLTVNDVIIDNDDQALSASTDDIFLDPESTLSRALSMSKDGSIPDDPDLAETVYFLGEDFEDSDIDYIELEDEEVNLNESEYKEMLDQLQQALDLDESAVPSNRGENNPVPNSAMSSHIVTKQLENMRNACIGAIGEEKFNKGYSYLKQVWSSKAMPSEHLSILQKLHDIVKDDNGCFLLEQLVYLENEAAP